ncbi:cytochrome C [Caenimonas sedimenti]|uniref:Cytochrome C n=1 Tax=Caenimonas sedimenti TaxID=2596921 RepID=A0A562ZWG8_9BURK|nr:cytochrome C [Caenimonas sedimenti]TWO72707.1 cytochrome C [Caenimonas sedimenti]
MKAEEMLGLALALATCFTAAHAQQTVSPTRGELLYNNHCIECHSTQMHWRERRQARDWTTLLGQVQRWQATAGLQWSDADVAEVARHLNSTIYRFAPPSRTQQLGSKGGDAVATAAPGHITERKIP